MAQPHGWNLIVGKMYMIPLKDAGNAVHWRYWKCMGIIYPPGVAGQYTNGAYTLLPIKRDTGEQFFKKDMPYNYIHGVNNPDGGVTYRWNRIAHRNNLANPPDGEHFLPAEAAAANSSPPRHLGGRKRTKRLRRRRRRRRRRTKRKRRRKRRSRRGRRNF